MASADCHSGLLWAWVSLGAQFQRLREHTEVQVPFPKISLTLESELRPPRLEKEEEGYGQRNSGSLATGF